MADVAVVHPCRFRWDIFNPFVPWRRMEATFYHKSPTLSRWRVSLTPTSRSSSHRTFQFSLNSCEENDILLANRLEVNISINGRSMHYKVEMDYFFWRGDRHEYQFEAEVYTHPQREEPHHLVIELEISFPYRTIKNQGNGLVFDDGDLRQLSDDLMEIYINSAYSNLRLMSRDQNSNYPVHSYILQARWSDFFEVHPFERIMDNTIKTNISDRVLREVLIYVYSGKLNTAGENWENPHYMTELFQVIDRYRLHHLYKVFARDESRQLRTTRKHLIITTHNFRLEDIDGQLLNNPSYERLVNPNSAYEFRFRIQFFFNSANPWLLYSLESRSQHGIYAQVNLEFVMNIVGRRSYPRSVHERDFTIRSNESVESGSCRVAGNSDFNNFLNGRRRSGRGRRIKHFIRCVLYLSDGTTVIQVESEDDIGLQDEGERFKVLSDHMYELLTRPTQPDLQVVCRAERPRNPHIPNEFYLLHKSIFAIRVPRWDLLENVMEGDDILEILTFNMESLAFRTVLSYIYSGKIFPVPIRHLDEVYNFAERSGMSSLRNLVNRLRLAGRNL